MASKLVSKKALRARFVNNDVFAAQLDKAWVLETPYDVREKAICDYVDAVKIAKEKVKLGKLKPFKMSFRSKKDPQQSFGVRNRLYERVGPSEFSFLRGSFKNAKVDATIRAREPLPEKIDYDARLVRTRLGEWYLCIPQLEEQELVAALGDDSQVPSPAVKRVCSLDPGVRTFQTLYDATTGAVIEVGSGDLARFYRLCKVADVLQSRRDTTHGKKRYKLQRARLRIFEKIRRLVKEIHCKFSTFLVENYSVVLLPSFDTSRMVVRNGRKLHSKTVRAMLTWSHYRFKQRLLDKASRSGGRCTVVVVGEENTSKTCTRCGHLHATLGGAKVFRCPRCALVIDRDHNGARNVLLKNASLFAFEVTTSTGGGDGNAIRR